MIKKSFWDSFWKLIFFEMNEHFLIILYKNFTFVVLDKQN